MNALDLVHEYLVENGVRAHVLVREKKSGDVHRIKVDDDITITSRAQTTVQVRFRRFQKPGKEFFWEQIWEFDLHKPDSLQKLLACVKDRFDGRPDKASWDELDGPHRTDKSPPLDFNTGSTLAILQWFNKFDAPAGDLFDILC